MNPKSLFLLGTLATEIHMNPDDREEESLFLLGTLATDDFFEKLPFFLQKAMLLSVRGYYTPVFARFE